MTRSQRIESAARTLLESLPPGKPGGRRDALRAALAQPAESPSDRYAEGWRAGVEAAANMVDGLDGCPDCGMRLPLMRLANRIRSLPVPEVKP